MREFTPIIARHGKVTHATSLLHAGQTSCGKRARGYRVALNELNCAACEAEIARFVKRVNRRKRA